MLLNRKIPTAIPRTVSALSVLFMTQQMLPSVGRLQRQEISEYKVYFLCDGQYLEFQKGVIVGTVTEAMDMV